MFKQELPLMFPEDERARRVAEALFDPFEYLMLRHREGKLRTNFCESLGKVSYQVPCHLRVQNIGLKTREVLKLVPDTAVDAIERCSGHNGTYAVKKEYAAVVAQNWRPVARQVDEAEAQYFTSDCPMAGHQIAGLTEAAQPTHPSTAAQGSTAYEWRERRDHGKADAPTTCCPSRATSRNGRELRAEGAWRTSAIASRRSART